MSVANAAPAVAAVAAAVEVANPIDVLLNSLNTNPYFIGTMMLLLNLGGRFLQLEISKGQEKFFQQVWVRRILVFTVIFVATRNVLVALFMSIIVLALLHSYLMRIAVSTWVVPKTKRSLQSLQVVLQLKKVKFFVVSAKNRPAWQHQRPRANRRNRHLLRSTDRI